MDIKRKKRYLQKLNELEDRIEFIEDNLKETSSRVTRKAVYKEFQEAAEIVADIGAMFVKDSGKLVSDDYKNLEICSKKLGFKKINELKRVTGLRNVLVHEYNGIDDKLALSSIEELIQIIKDFGEEMEKWIKNF